MPSACSQLTSDHTASKYYISKAPISAGKFRTIHKVRAPHKSSIQNLHSMNHMLQMWTSDFSTSPLVLKKLHLPQSWELDKCPFEFAVSLDVQQFDHCVEFATQFHDLAFQLRIVDVYGM